MPLKKLIFAAKAWGIVIPSKLETDVEKMLNHEKIAEKTTKAWLSRLRNNVKMSINSLSIRQSSIVDNIPVVDTFLVTF